MRMGKLRDEGAQHACAGGLVARLLRRTPSQAQAAHGPAPRLGKLGAGGGRVAGMGSRQLTSTALEHTDDDR